MGVERQIGMQGIVRALRTGLPRADVAADPDRRQQVLRLGDARAGGSGDADAAARIGRAYLAANPGEANLDTLLAAIDSALGGGIEAADSDPQGVLTALQRAVRAEYLRGESVKVQGWVLSVTETRVYALLALAADT